MSNFGFLAAEWPELFKEARLAEDAGKADPRASCFYSRRTLEFALKWLYRADGALHSPYKNDLDGMISEPSMGNLVGDPIRAKMTVIRLEGNKAVHRAVDIHEQGARRVLGELFQVMYWIARHYTRDRANLPAAGLRFDPGLIPEAAPNAVRLTRAQLQAMAAELERSRQDLDEARRRNAELDAEVRRLRAEIAAAKSANEAANQALPDLGDVDEATTRTVIDLLLNEAGWALDAERDREFPVDGLPNTPSGKGKVDYVLWDDDGAPLGLVEAKRTSKDPITGRQQAKAYADALEDRFGQRPVIFCSNGYTTEIWDDLAFPRAAAKEYPPRLVQGFYTKGELRRLVDRRRDRKSPGEEPINEAIVNRSYQSRAIRSIGEAFEHNRQRQALLVMATGAGKTRTVIALTDLLQRAGWIGRVLFLCDRQALVRQAVAAFKAHLPDTTTVNLLEEKNAEGGVYVSTYPTMMGLAGSFTEGGVRRFGPGFFDLVVIDEAHRSVFHKYKALLDYFDALRVGLTATPRNEIDRNTYRTFGLEEGVPTDAYELDQAVKDHYLVPPTAINVPLKFPLRGMHYDELPDDEQEQWELAEWDDDDGVPGDVTAEDVNKYVMNADTNDKMLETLMSMGNYVGGGDRLGKTIIFARNTRHAEFIVRRFEALFPSYGGSFAEVITYQTAGAQSRIEAFAKPDSAPYIAVSVDMLDTGIDIREVLNLVFAKPVHSKTKFWQMVGRGTRLCPDLYGPNRDKDGFAIFDLYGNVDFFRADIAETEGRVQPSLRERLFRRRADLLYQLDHADPGLARPAEQPPAEDGTETDAGLRHDVAERLRAEVAGMDTRDVQVRPHLQEVEKYREAGAWRPVTAEVRDQVGAALAGLPSAYAEDENGEEAKRFDLLALRLQLAVLGVEDGYDELKRQAQDIAGALLDPTARRNPVVARQEELLGELVGEEWWDGVTLPMLERMRRRLRGLARLVPKTRKRVVYLDIGDELGEISESALDGASPGVNMPRFEAKVRTYLRSHEDQLAVQKLLRNRQITRLDMDALRQIFVEAKIGTEKDIEAAAAKYGGLGLFLRSMSGLDRETAVAAFDAFQAGKTFSADQLHFLGLLINYLAKNGALDPDDLFKQPFTDLAPTGPGELFPDEADVRAISDVLNTVKATAVPAEATG